MICTSDNIHAAAEAFSPTAAFAILSTFLKIYTCLTHISLYFIIYYETS